MRGYKDLAGQTFGRLTVVNRSETGNKAQVFWNCNCSCGQVTVVRGVSLRRGDTKSCGCLRSENCTRLFGTPRRKYADKKEKRKAYYERHRAKLKIKREKRYEVGRRVIEDAKNKPCLDCGKRFHYSLMDFDHSPDQVKLFDISREWGHVPLDLLHAEIAKCEVVCALCHRVRTWNRSHPNTPITLDA